MTANYADPGAHRCKKRSRKNKKRKKRKKTWQE